MKRVEGASLLRAAFFFAPALLAAAGLVAALPHQSAAKSRAGPEMAVTAETDQKRERIPGIDPNEPLSEQLDRDKGVIEPPPTGDEGIHAEVPNPEAGHEEEVIPPPGTPEGNQHVEPK